MHGTVLYSRAASERPCIYWTCWLDCLPGAIRQAIDMSRDTLGTCESHLRAFLGPSPRTPPGFPIWIDYFLNRKNGNMAEWSKALESGQWIYPVRKGASSNLAVVILSFFLCSRDEFNPFFDIYSTTIIIHHSMITAQPSTSLSTVSLNSVIANSSATNRL
jgi:hypothetical protein